MEVSEEKGSPVPDRCLDHRKSRHGRRVGTQDAGAERNGGDEGQRPQHLALVVGKAAFGADQQREFRLVDFL